MRARFGVMEVANNSIAATLLWDVQHLMNGLADWLR